MAGFTPVEEVEKISMGPRESAEKVVRDFFREGKVGDHCITMLLVGLEEEVELMDGKEEEQEEEEGTLGSGDGRYDSCGGGGGSYNDGNDQDNACCYSTAGHGQVTVTFL